MSTKSYALKAESRDRAGKGVARALRREKKIPAVIYGDKKEAVPIALPFHEVNTEYHKGHMYTTICDMDLDGKKHMLLVRDVQVHPVNEDVLHVDFLRVSDKTKIEIEVPVHFINHEQSPGLDEGGGVLNVVRYQVELMCSAVNIPEHIDVDLSGKEIGDSIKMSDAVLPEGTKPVIDDRDFTIATIQEPKEYVEEEIEPIAEEGEEGEAAAEGEEGEAKEGEDAKEGEEGGEKKDEKSEGEGKKEE